MAMKKAVDWIVNDIKINDTSGPFVSYPAPTARPEFLEVIVYLPGLIPLHPRQRIGWRCTCSRCP